MHELRPGEEGYAYFFLGANGLCKIGKAADVPLRLMQLQSEQQMTIHCHHVVASNDAYWLEAKLHRFFREQRSYGEWFALTAEELLAVLALKRHDRLLIDSRDFDDPNCGGPLTIPAKVLGSKGGKKGGPARASRLSAAERSAIARKGGLARQRRR